MAKVSVEAKIELEIYNAGKLLVGNGLGQYTWGNLLEKSIREAAAMTAKEERQKITNDQQVIYNEAMDVLVRKLTEQLQGQESNTVFMPAHYAKAQAKRLKDAGYFTNGLELLEEARKLIAGRKEYI